jgi:hypothetical protein
VGRFTTSTKPIIQSGFQEWLQSSTFLNLWCFVIWTFLTHTNIFYRI